MATCAKCGKSFRQCPVCSKDTVCLACKGLDAPVQKVEFDKQSNPVRVWLLGHDQPVAVALTPGVGKGRKK